MPRTGRKMPSKAKPAPARPAAPSVKVPAGAEQLDANSWRWTDPQGVVWIYRKTPFGLNHYREQDEARASRAPVKPEPVRVIDLGASYRFERSTPFGAQSWVRRKTELNAEEKGFVAAQAPAAAGATAKAR